MFKSLIAIGLGSVLVFFSTMLCSFLYFFQLAPKSVQIASIFIVISFWTFLLFRFVTLVGVQSKVSSDSSIVDKTSKVRTGSNAFGNVFISFLLFFNFILLTLFTIGIFRGTE
jgi:hypothetical protein